MQIRNIARLSGSMGSREALTINVCLTSNGIKGAEPLRLLSKHGGLKAESVSPLSSQYKIQLSSSQDAILK